jgi:hypothetical protein
VSCRLEEVDGLGLVSMLTPVPAGLAELDPSRGLLRLLRGAGVGVSAVGVSLAGHVVANDVVPPPLVLGIVLLLATLCAWALSGVRWTPVSLAGVMLAVQSVLHLVFSADAAASGSHLTVSMLVGHVAASVVMVAVLCRGEALVWAVVEGLSLRVWRLLRPAAPVPRATLCALVLLPAAAVPRCWHGSVLPRRGPPLTTTFVLVPV